MAVAEDVLGMTDWDSCGSTVPWGPSELQVAKAAQVGIEAKEPTTEPAEEGVHHYGKPGHWT
jgi:hypothetical protein